MAHLENFQLPQSQKGEGVKLTQLDSTAICCAGYNSTEQQMFVKFRTSPVIYGYSDVTSLMWEDFSLAPSKGSWVAVNLVARPCQHVVTKYGLPYPDGIEFDFKCPQTVKQYSQPDRAKANNSPGYRPAWYSYREKYGARLSYRIIGTPPIEQPTTDHVGQTLAFGDYQNKPA